jgi:transposase-like protein
MVMPQAEKKDLVKRVERFGSESGCRNYLEELRWPNGIYCPRCNSEKQTRIQSKSKFHCNSCQYQFSVTAGTIFHDSHLPLWKWFASIYLMIETEKGISASQLKRVIGVSYKTAWYLCHRIRAAMKDESVESLKGYVEVDEAWGGAEKPATGSKRGLRRGVVVGEVAGEPRIRLQVIRGKGRKNVGKFVRKHTAPPPNTVQTEIWPEFIGKSGDVTGQMAVSWDLLGRSISGPYHKVSLKHLESYLDELEFRINNRKNPWMFRDILRRLLNSKRLTYEKLKNR